MPIYFTLGKYKNIWCEKWFDFAHHILSKATKGGRVEGSLKSYRQRRFSRMPSPRKSKKGSLLLEVLLSIMILSTSVTVIIQAMTSSLRAMAYGTQYTQITNVLENEMAGLIFENLTGEPLAEIKGDGQTEEFYKVSSQGEFVDDGDSEHMKDVRLKVSWLSNRKNHQISINTYFIEGLNP